MRDDADIAGAVSAAERGHQPGIAGAEAVDARQIRMRLEHAHGGGLRGGIVVEAFDRADDLELGEFAPENAGKALEALAMVAQAERAGDDADLARSAEAAEQRGGAAAGGLVVDADELPAGRAGQVGDQGEHGDAAAGDGVDGPGHRRIVGRHHHGAIGLAGAEAVEPGNQGRGIERMVLHRRQRQPLVAGGAGAAGDGGGEAFHEGVAAAGDEEHHAQVAGARQERSGKIAAKVQGLDRGLDLFGGFRPHPGTRIEHAVDGGERDPGGARHIVHGGAPPLQLVVQIRPPDSVDVAAQALSRQPISAWWGKVIRATSSP